MKHLRVGRLFTYNGTRYEPGDKFDIESIAESRRTSFIRMFGLTSIVGRRKKKLIDFEVHEDEGIIIPDTNGD